MDIQKVETIESDSVVMAFNNNNQQQTITIKAIENNSSSRLSQLLLRFYFQLIALQT
jgi:uncharacterized protein YccT (UPF0319 family)